MAFTSNLTAVPLIAEMSDATPGLFNRAFSQLSDNIGTVNAGGVPFNVASGSTWASIGLAANSNNSDYLRLVDSSGQRSTYRIGSAAGGTADGLNIFDESGNTMIASFSKQSVRFYQNVVGPVFDIGGALASTLNAATFGVATDSNESRIQSAINAASAQALARVYVPSNMYPYSASSISFIYTVQMTREGGDQIAYDIKAYGAFGDGLRDDRPAILAALASAGTNGVVLVPSASSFFKVGSTVTLPSGVDHLAIRGFGSGSRIRPSSTSYDAFGIDKTCSYIEISSLNLLGASGDTGLNGRCGIRCKAGHCTFKDNEISGFPNGIQISSSTFYAAGSHGAIVGNFIHDLVGLASGNGYGAYTDQPYTLIANNRFQNVPRHDIYCSGSDIGADKSVVIGNVSTGNQFQAIAIYNLSTYSAVHGISVIGNSITSCAIAIRLDVNAQYCTVVGNSVDSCTAAAYQLDGGVNAGEQPEGNTIIGNTVINAQGDTPILLTNASRNVVSGNIVHSNGKLYGIFCTSSGAPPEYPTGNTITGNTVKGVTNSSVVVDATCVNTTVRDNYSTKVDTIGAGANMDTSIITATTTPTTVDVFNRRVVVFNAGSNITVTNFTNGREGQEITCYFQQTQPIWITNANAFLAAGAANFQSTQLDTIKLVKYGTNWFEVSRSVN